MSGSSRFHPTEAGIERVHYSGSGPVISALGPAVAYRHRTTDEYDRKIVELVRESGGINARIVKIALDLESVAASRVLGDLVDRGILTKTSDAQRGPSVTYGPGSSFPSSSKKRTKSRPNSDDAPDPPDSQDQLF